MQYSLFSRSKYKSLCVGSKNVWHDSTWKQMFLWWGSRLERLRRMERFIILPLWCPCRNFFSSFYSLSSSSCWNKWYLDKTIFSNFFSYFKNQFLGLNPDPEKHLGFLEFETNLAAPGLVRLCIQAVLDISPVSSVSALASLPTVKLPILWVKLVI